MSPWSAELVRQLARQWSALRKAACMNTAVHNTTGALTGTTPKQREEKNGKL